MVEPVRVVDPERVRGNLDRIRAEVGPEVEILLASKYVPLDQIGALAEAGVGLLGENRHSDLEAKRAAYPELFTWDFIGNLQSRKVRDVLPLVRLVHSVATESVLEQLGKHGGEGTEVLIQVNVAREEGKGGFAPEDLASALDRCPVTVVGLSTMPPFADDPEASRPHFARLAELAGEHGLRQLSMGTSQDWRVAVEEGATTIRVGSALFA